MSLPSHRLGTALEPSLAPARNVSPAARRDYSLAWPTPMLWGMFGGGGSNAGVPVTPLSALQAATVYGCVKCLAEDLAKMPMRLERREEGGWREEKNHPLVDLLAEPNSWMTPFQFWAYMVASVELRGNAMAAVLRDEAAIPRALIPLNWDRVSVLLSPKGVLYYLVSHPMVGDGVTLHQDDVIHLRNPLAVDGGYLGISPIAAAQDVVGLSLAAQTHGAVLFRQGTQLGGYLKTAQNLSKESAAEMGQAWMNTYGGVQNAAKLAVLHSGVEFEKLGMTSEEAQFLESRKFSVIEICRLFRVPPHKVQDLTAAHFDNLELSERAYVNDALQPLATEIEQRGGRTLMFSDERGVYRLRFDFDELLRGDFKSRMEGYDKAISARVMTPNQARAREGWNPYLGGDRYYGPVNYGVVGSSDGSAPPPPPTFPQSSPRPEGALKPADTDPGADARPLGTETADQAVV